MHIDRRSLLLSGCAAPLAGLLPDAAEAVRAATAEVASRDRFLERVGSDFVLREGDAIEVARLLAVHAAPTDADGCFALEFALRDGARARQATWEFMHPGLPHFAALAAPSNAAGDRLVVVFNSPG